MRRDSVDLRQALQRAASRQGGHFTARDARSAGYSHQAQKYHHDRGVWERVARGVYRFVEWPDAEHPDLIVRYLASGRRAVASHQTALAVHGVGDFMPERIHMTVPATFRGRVPSTILHHRDLQPDEVELREGFALTVPARALVDVAGEVDADQLQQAVAEALSAGLVTRSELATRGAQSIPASATIEHVLASSP